MLSLRSESLNHSKLIKRKFRLTAIQNLVILKAFQKELTQRENGKEIFGILNVRWPLRVCSSCRLISNMEEELKLHHCVHRDGCPIVQINHII